MSERKPAPIEYARPDTGGFRFRIGHAVVLLLLVAAGTFLFMPSGGRACDIMPRQRCYANLHQIGLAILLFQQDHGQRYPDSLADLVSPDLLSPNVLICGETNDSPAVLPTTSPTTREVVAALAVPGHCSYVYVGRGLTDVTATATTVVAYEPLSNHGDGCHVLYGDGHVEWVDAKHAATLPTTGPATFSPTSP